MGRIVKKRLAINNPRDIRIRYVVDGVFIFSTMAKAKRFVERK